MIETYNLSTFISENPHHNQKIHLNVHTQRSEMSRTKMYVIYVEWYIRPTSNFVCDAGSWGGGGSGLR